MKFNLFLLIAFSTFFVPSAISHAQEIDEVPDIENVGNVVGLEKARETVESGDLYSQTANPNDLISPMRRRAFEVDGVSIPKNDYSLFFTPREIDLISEARNGLVARLATEDEIEASQRMGNRPKGPREVSLEGILFTNNTEWVIWINNQKITPDRIPPEVTDIRVGKDYVRLKWYDSYTNKIFPIKLQPQQRFNIDTRIFLPG